jgi:error-prone DNA polymerase
VGVAMAAFNRSQPPAPPVLCVKCGSDDESMIEVVRDGIRDSVFGIRSRAPSPEPRIPTRTYFCNTCAHEWTVPLPQPERFTSIEDMTRRTGLRRDELTTLAEIGALNAFTNERRSALWQIERVVRPAGELFEESELGIRDSGFRIRDSVGIRTQEPKAQSREPISVESHAPNPDSRGSGAVESRTPNPESRMESPLRPMDANERLRADYAGTGLTIGPHPMALRRDDMALRGVMRAVDLLQTRDGRRVRVAGMVITRQRPGTAKGFVFLTLEDETGISNIIVRPDLFDRERMTVVRQPFLLVEGILQHQDGVRSIQAERLHGIDGAASVEAHDFY